MAANEPPLDEIQWRSPQIVAEMGGVHSNTVLHYFARSPFFEETSNNAIVTNQAFNNASMYHLIQTREAFEGRLRTMAGLEYLVAQEPAEMGPGMGTGVWVIRKQTRKKRPGVEDEITVHNTYFVVGDNIYQAPTLADILVSRVNTITEAMSKVLPAADSARTWTPSLGNVYRQSPTINRPDDNTPETTAKTTTKSKDTSLDAELQRLAEESFFRHLKHGSDYIDEKPITGQPGNFHIASSGRKEKASFTSNASSTTKPLALPKTEGGIGGLGLTATQPGGAASGKNGKDKKEGKTEKSPRPGNAPKLKRKKSKAGATPTPTPT
ncbi:related to RNA polymerase II transcriptional regulation mediator MED6 [Cephalotrichum gorgonifer]|uniref:Mediator of RNA polymerase II transcription subunit 6 n=1 Tax=Cephalotrichum gorgonifer TaxID=2041049 RepID=A0AAE8MQN5_9PEZI|nr:related to RNA polymerase II transcriptional regulation mediator MED6 [Cephalotrichum gorgonifer]